jgi:antitoxin ParD1/3/4
MTASTSSLPPDLQQFVQDQLATGKYASASEVVSDAVRLMRERDARLKELRRDIELGVKQLDDGDFIEIESDAALHAFFEDIATRREQRMSAKSGEK